MIGNALSVSFIPEIRWFPSGNDGPVLINAGFFKLASLLLGNTCPLWASVREKIHVPRLKLLKGGFSVLSYQPSLDFWMAPWRSFSPISQFPDPRKASS